MNIHLVEQLNSFFKMDGDIWESGWWSINEDKARELVGGNIYFHKSQQEPSFYGGMITGYRLQPDGQHQGRVVFKLKYIEKCRNVRTGRSGWSKKMKIIDE